MTTVPLCLGPLAADGFVTLRSGIRWLCQDGHLCRPGEIIGYCNIGLMGQAREGRTANPFADEMRDLQVAFAPRFAGRLRIAPDASRGGALDQHYYWLRWTPDFVIAHIDCLPGAEPDSDADSGLRLLLLAGMRMADNTESHAGLLTGWLQRSRAWWTDGGNEFGTVLSLGICELAGVIRGERSAFTELFEALSGPAHFVHLPDNSLVPSARIVTEQLLRTPADCEAIAADFARTFTNGGIVPAASDWIFAGSLLGALQLSPLTQHFDILTREGLQRTGAADAVILSLSSEAPAVLRHRRLGYSLNCHSFRIAHAGPAVRAWLKANFEPIRRGPDDILRDYCHLIDTARAKLNTRFLVVNTMSTSATDDIHNYQSFDRPLGLTLSTVRSKELNLMLHDLAGMREVSIVDLDAIAVDLGAASHLPDGIHSSGLLQAELRAEIVRILRALKIRGFGSAPRQAESRHLEFNQ